MVHNTALPDVASQLTNSVDATLRQSPFACLEHVVFLPNPSAGPQRFHSEGALHDCPCVACVNRIWRLEGAIQDAKGAPDHLSQLPDKPDVVRHDLHHELYGVDVAGHLLVLVAGHDRAVHSVRSTRSQVYKHVASQGLSQVHLKSAICRALVWSL
jgi:hypothetical protein